MLRAIAAVIAQPWVPLVIGLLIVIGVGTFTSLTVSASEEYDQRVEQSIATVGAADSVMLSLSEMNASQRGFVLNRNPAFRARYAAEKKELAVNLRQLAVLMSKSAISQQSIRNFQETLETRLEGFDDVERFIADKDYVGAGEYSSTARPYTDDVRQALGVIKQEALTSLKVRQEQDSEAAKLALALSIAGLLIATLLILVSIAMLVRKTAQLQNSNIIVLEMAKNLEQRVDERTAELAAANDEIQRFAYIVSHDLRSPLVNVMGFTSELAEAHETMAGYLSELEAAPDVAVPAEVSTAVFKDMPEAMGFIRTSTALMDRLIKAILQIAREGSRPLSSQKIDLDQLFAQLAGSLSGQLAAADATLEIGSLPVVQGDELAIEQIFGNLLDNAVKYLRQGVPGRISVTGETRGTRAIISITDNGRGVAKADLERIFELFRRAGEQDKPGEGIGLAHVQALVRRLGGKITVTSEAGQGSCFTVKLPLTMTTRN